MAADASQRTLLDRFHHAIGENARLRRETRAAVAVMSDLVTERSAIAARMRQTTELSRQLAPRAWPPLWTRRAG